MRFFFFSSRRRHTRFDCDWSSDVCSSDAAVRRVRGAPAGSRPGEGGEGRGGPGTNQGPPISPAGPLSPLFFFPPPPPPPPLARGGFVGQFLPPRRPNASFFRHSHAVFV